MVEFENQRDLEAWLRTRSRDEIAIFAARAALRSLPTLQASDVDNVAATVVLPVFRALAAAWVGAQYPTQAATRAAARAAATARTAYAATTRATATATDAYAAVAVAARAAAAARATAYVTGSSHAIATDAAYAAAATRATDTAAAAAAAEATALTNDGVSVAALARQPLWPKGEPQSLAGGWAALKTALHAADEGWEVWTSWYEARLAGVERINESLEIARVTEITEEEWDAGPVVVNARLRVFERWFAPEPTGTVPPQRPATYQFRIVDGRISARPFEPDLVANEASALFAALKKSADDLIAAAQQTNSPLAGLLSSRTERLAAVLGDELIGVDPGSLLAEWDTFEIARAAASSEEGRQEISLVLQTLVEEIDRHLSSLAALSPHIGEIVAARRLLSLATEDRERLDEVHASIVFVAELEAVSRVIDPSTGAALRAHHERIESAKRAVEVAPDFDAKHAAELHLDDLRKLQLLDLANFEAGVIEATEKAAVDEKGMSSTRAALTRIKVQLGDRLPNEIADSIVSLVGKTIRDAPLAAVFMGLGALLSPGFGFLAGAVPLLFGGATSRLIRSFLSSAGAPDPAEEAASDAGGGE